MPKPSLQELAKHALHHAQQQGAEAVEIAISNETGFHVSARNGDVETLEHHQEQSLQITVYSEQRSGSASTSDLSKFAIETTAAKAVAFARYAGVDQFSGLPERELLAKQYPDLSLQHEWSINPSEAIQIALQCESVALEQDKRITKSEGASVSTYNSDYVLVNSDGFMGSYPSSYHSINVGVIAEQDQQMQRDFEYTVARNPDQLDDVALIAKRAASKTVARLGARSVKTQQCPVIFHAPVAKGILSCLISAVSGSNLYRQSTFLLDQLNQQVFPKFVHIYQEPHLLCAMGSAPFDNEGVMTVTQDYVRDGVLCNYVLGSYSARKLGMTSTGNAGGVFNLSIAPGEHNLQQLMKQMHTGLLVTELMGQGINITNGNYSRAASGFWIENGEIQYPVEEITIAGNLKQMFANFVAIANDVDKRGSIRSGSIMIDGMVVAGMDENGGSQV